MKCEENVRLAIVHVILNNKNLLSFWKEDKNVLQVGASDPFSLGSRENQEREKVGHSREL